MVPNRCSGDGGCWVPNEPAVSARCANPYGASNGAKIAAEDEDREHDEASDEHAALEADALPELVHDGECGRGAARRGGGAG